MSVSAPRPTPPSAPALVVPCSGASARQVSETHAEVVLLNPLVHASLIADAAQLRTLGDAFHALAADLTPAGPKLVTPGGAGSLVVPRG